MPADRNNNIMRAENVQRIIIIYIASIKLKIIAYNRRRRCSADGEFNKLRGDIIYNSIEYL